MAMERTVPAKEISKQPTIKSLFALCLPKVPPTKLYELLKGDLVITEPEYAPYKNISTWPNEYLLKHKEDLCALIAYLKNDAENKESLTEYGQIMNKIKLEMPNQEDAGMLLAHLYQESQSYEEVKDIFPNVELSAPSSNPKPILHSFIRNVMNTTTVHDSLLSNLKDAWYRTSIDLQLTCEWLCAPCCRSKMLPQNEATLVAYLKGLYLDGDEQSGCIESAIKEKNALERLKKFEALSLQKILEMQLQKYINTVIESANQLCVYNYRARQYYNYLDYRPLDYTALILLAHIVFSTIFHQCNDLETAEKIIDSVTQNNINDETLNTFLKTMHIDTTSKQYIELVKKKDACRAYRIKEATSPNLLNAFRCFKEALCNYFFTTKTEAMSFITNARNYRKEHCTASADKKNQYDRILEKISNLMVTAGPLEVERYVYEWD